jgi:hypothetical protein
MKVTVDVNIKGSKEAIWRAITDIEGSVNRISGIQKVEVLEKPENTFIGFKWRETRIMFGKEATEIMWVTEAEENKGYKTRAESHGAVYISSFDIEEKEDGCILAMGFESQAVSLGGRIMDKVFGKMMKGATEKDLRKDLEDIKASVEGGRV